MMEEHVLSYARIIKLNDHLAEVIVNPEVEMTMNEVTEYHDWISQNLSDPCLILANKLDSYTYTFEAQQNIGTLPQIKAIAWLESQL